MKKLILILTTIFIFVGTAYAQPIDLREWSKQGNSAYGTWNVATDGSSVIQTQNDPPTYFVSEDTYINYEFEGKFEVQTASDDDFIGFVFGWQSIDDYYLFDWKQGTQTSNGVTAYEGFTLSHITDDSEVKYWGHTGSGIETLDTNYGDNGWEDNTLYDFTLNYTQTGFTIDINDTEIFNETGSFTTGKFGFYNNSQSHVFYQGFEADENPPTGVPEPTTMILLASGFLGLGIIKRKKK